MIMRPGRRCRGVAAPPPPCHRHFGLRRLRAGGRRPASIKVLNGAAAGREVPLTKVVTTVGKPGVQVASITKRPTGYVFAHVEGARAAQRQRRAAGRRLGAAAQRRRDRAGRHADAVHPATPLAWEVCALSSFALRRPGAGPKVVGLTAPAPERAHAFHADPRPRLLSGSIAAGCHTTSFLLDA
jgi:hypothetical protein